MNASVGPGPGSDPPAVDARGIAIGYGDGLVVEGLDLAVEAGEMVVLLGPSGSGKTTILAAIAGFLPLRHGELRLAGRLVAGPGRHDPPERRDVAVVFQGAALWPHLSAVETVAYPIRRSGGAGAPAREQALAILDQLGVRELAERRPAEMSGGEQQRVGLGRALARRAALHLFDEPTAHLDGPLRRRLLDTIAAARRAAGAAGIYATHDTAEALAIADRIALVRGGRIVQTGSPLEVYERPIDEWAARLTGPASVIEATVVAGGADGMAMVEIAGSRRKTHLGRGSSAGPTRLIVRPDWATLGGALAGRVTAVRFAGTHTDVDLATPAGTVTIRCPGPPTVAVGDAPGWDLSRAHPLDPPG
jgi:ABC-type Fe3+/spermidine/putrescine transport system ATPase subunit